MTYAEYLANRRGLSPGTVAQYQRTRRRWETANVAPLAWLLALDLANMPGPTVATYRAAVCHYLDYTGTEFDRALVKRVARGRSQQRTYRHGVSEAVLDDYNEALNQSSVTEPCWTILRLLPYTGLRISGACNLRAGAVTKIGDHRALQVIGKGNKVRSVLMNKTAHRILTDWRKVRKTRLAGVSSPWLFPSAQNPERPVAADTVRFHLRQLRSAYDLPKDLTPHSLRHFYATTLLNKGVDLLTLKDLLGHASITTTQLYAKPSVDRLAKAAALLDD